MAWCPVEVLRRENQKEDQDCFFLSILRFFNHIDRLLRGRLALMAEASDADTLADEFARSLASCSVELICLRLFSI
jgi:hypothetical protein